jgi:dienelactone hydrolase
MKHGHYSAVLLVSISCLYAVAQTQKAAELPPPGQVGTVICASDPTESYALYLPSAYTTAKRWPIIYLFDPAGRGQRPVDLYNEIGERYGFILAGSNNSRNFSSDQSKGVNAIWEDTHARLSLDGHRSYASGFSGGARVAGAMALSSQGQVAGVIAHGAGYPSSKAGSKDDLPYFFAVGNEDFNWPEVINIRREREAQGSPYRVRVYPGKHQWAPAAVMEEAVLYMNLKAMQTRNLASNAGSIDRAYEKLKVDAAEAENRKDLIAEFSVDRALVSDFTGLRDVKEFAPKLASIQQSPALKAALKEEQEQISEQSRLEQEIMPKIAALADNSAPDTTSLRIEVRQQLGALMEQARHNKNETKRLIAGRAFGGIFVGTMEDGQQQLAARHFEKAEAYFDLMRQVTDDPWPMLLLAETHAAAGNRRLAVKDLHEAVRRGVKDRTVIENDPQLQILRGEPDFQKLLEELGK